PRMPVSVGRYDVPPLRELSAIAGGHVLEVLRHPKRQVVLIHDLSVSLLELNELLYELAIAQHSVRVIRRVIHDSAETESSGGRANGQGSDKHGREYSFLHSLVSFRVWRLLKCVAEAKEAARSRSFV